MSKTKIFTVALVASIAAVYAQEQPLKPLSEGELLKTIDSIGVGDPLTKQPLGLGDDKPALPGSGLPKKKDEKPSKKEKGPTEITALEANFDNKTHQAIFVGQVVVKDPEFNVECDRLTAYLKHDDKPADKQDGAADAATPKAEPATGGKGATPAPKATAKATPKPMTGLPAPKTVTPAPAKADKAKESKGGGLEKAIAEADSGKRVTIIQEKVEADGSVSHNIGHARRAVYDAVTGDITLTGNPDVQQGINQCIALEDSTVMVLNREGRMHVTGAHKTVIKDTSSDPSNANKSR